jgi:hypothetical protein
MTRPEALRAMLSMAIEFGLKVKKMTRSVYVATSESKAADATDNDVPKTPKPDDPADLADRLIKAVGSKEKAKQQIDASKVQGSGGRPAEYLVRDAQVLFEVETLENEYRFRNQKSPKRWPLIKEAVSQHFTQFDMGKTEDAAAHRIYARGSLAAILFDWMSKHRPELLQHLPPDAKERALSMDSHDLTAILLGLGIVFAGFGERRELRWLRMGPLDCVTILSGLAPPSMEWSRS